MRLLETVIAFALGGLAVGMMVMNSGQSSPSNPPAAEPVQTAPVPVGAQELVLGAGCFWCVETMFEELRGVIAVESGYAGGDRAGVTYQEVGMGSSGHAEVIKITFDPKEISREDLLRIFFTVHDPTTLNRQGNDVGPQYRSAIFFTGEEEKATAEKIKREIEEAKIWPNPIVTTLEPLRNYTKAEDYHQDYFRRFETGSPATQAGMNAGYCRVVIEPKVRKFRQKFADRLKE